MDAEGAWSTCPGSLGIAFIVYQVSVVQISWPSSDRGKLFKRIWTTWLFLIPGISRNTRLRSGETEADLTGRVCSPILGPPYWTVGW